MSKGIFLQLGSNIESRTANLEHAKALITQKTGIIVAESTVYETKPWGVENQNDFFNQVIRIESDLSARELMRQCLAIEEEMGRKREVKWGPRNIDIDLLFYDEQVLVTKELILPHPRIGERMFVLVPLCEVAPYFIHPVEKVTCNDLMRLCM